MEYVVRAPKLPQSAPPVLVILHGYGADEHDLFSISEQLDDRLLIISLRAPIQLAGGGYAWYHLEQTIKGLMADDESRHQSEQLLLAAIPEIIEAVGGDASKLHLMGFSQGAAISYALLSRKAEFTGDTKLRSLIAMSGYIPRDVIPTLRAETFTEFPVLITHGEFDDLVPAIALDEAESLLRSRGANVIAKLYETGHGLLPETISDISKWLTKRLDNPI
ncbi:MAG: dienelactone hydrolase family protein [Candidatus Kapaibacterium sp.]